MIFKQQLTVVMPRAGGGSSTPRPNDFITAVSGIPDHPLARVMTIGVVIASEAKQSMAQQSKCGLLRRLRSSQ
jgi:hypothetical protein